MSIEATGRTVSVQGCKGNGSLRLPGTEVQVGMMKNFGRQQRWHSDMNELKVADILLRKQLKQYTACYAYFDTIF